MKSIIFAIALLASSNAMAEAYWSCQCFASISSEEPLGGTEVNPALARTLADANWEAKKVCAAQIDPQAKVASCQRFVRADH